jgi:hypothetical protein
MQKTFPAEAIRRVIITDIAGELVVRGWEDKMVSVESESNVVTLTLEGETLMVGGAKEGVVIAVPYETTIKALRVADDISIVNVLHVELREARSDCFLKGIHGEVSLGRIHGELTVEDVRTLRLVDRVDKDASFVGVESLKAVGLGRDVLCKNVHEAQFQYGIGGDLKVENVDVLYAGSIGRDCVIHGNGHTAVNLANIGIDLIAHGVVQLHAQNIGADCEVHDSEQAEIVLGNVGGELEITGALLVEAYNIGRKCELRDIQGNVSIKHIGSHADIAGIGGDLSFGHVGAQAEIRGVVGRVALGFIGGNLELQASFSADSTTNVRVGGNATIDLPETANMTIQAMAGGNVSDQKSGFTRRNKAVLVYGEGVAQLKVRAGGNINLRSSAEFRTTGEDSWGWRDWNWKDWDWKDWQFAYATDDESGEMTDSKERKRRQRADWQSRGAGFNIRFNERAWRVDPAHIDHIVAQARQAAADGIQGAFEAVDQALRNMNLSTPVPPYPDSGPVVPPMEPMQPMEPMRPMSSEYPDGTEPSVTADAAKDENKVEATDLEEAGAENQGQSMEAEKAVVDVEQEREAILRMIAQGRITPDEGDMLLEALN